MSEQEKIIKDYLTAIRKQDNRITAPPYFFVIRDEMWIMSDGSGDEGPGESERSIWVDSHDLENYFYTVEDAIKSVMECDDGFSKSEAESHIDEEYDEITEVRIWKKCGMFLTETDANEHFRRNRYHYSKNAHVYVDHAWRAPELEAFFNALFDHFDVQEPWYSDVRFKKNRERSNPLTTNKGVDNEKD